MDRLLYDGRPVGFLANCEHSKDESGTLRLIRTTCKAVQTHGCEKLGDLSDLYTFSCEGNQYAVLFYNGGILYALYNNLKHLFENAKDENKLLKAVHSDLQIKSYLCGVQSSWFD